MKFWNLVVKTLKQKNNQAVAEKVVKITESTTNIKSPSYPDLNKYRVNPSGKRYDDTYITGVGYKLREILLLVWWGRTKNPRKPTSKPPRYFFYDYHLNTKKTTDMFIRDGLLKKNKEGCITLTLSGKVLYDEYKSSGKYIRIKDISVNYQTWIECSTDGITTLIRPITIY
ncbi:TPA: hypothetical protein ACQMWT_001380 [Streptococcus pyogenes]